MKKLLIAAFVCSAVGVPTAALADHVGVTFDSRGECESFLAQARNSARDADRRGGGNPGEFNRNYNISCERNEDGTFTTVRR